MARAWQTRNRSVVDLVETWNTSVARRAAGGWQEGGKARPKERGRRVARRVAGAWLGAWQARGKARYMMVTTSWVQGSRPRARLREARVEEAVLKKGAGGLAQLPVPG